MDVTRALQRAIPMVQTRFRGWLSRSAARRFPLVAIAFSLAVASACSDDPVEPRASEPTMVRLAEVAPAELAVGDTFPLGAEVLDQYGGVLPGMGVAWASDDTLVATVDTSGVVTAVGEGTATITASSGGVVATVQFTVADPMWAVLYALYVSTGWRTTGRTTTTGCRTNRSTAWHGVDFGDPPCYLGYTNWKTTT